MIIYEVNCLVTDEIASDFECWLSSHVEAVLRFDGFVGAEVQQLPQDPELQKCTNVRGFSVRYKLSSMDALEHYLRTMPKFLLALVESVARCRP